MGAGGKLLSRQKLGYRAVSDPDFFPKLLSPLSTCIIHLPEFTIFLKSPETKTKYKQNTVKMVKAGKIPCSIFVLGPMVDGSPL